MSTSRRPAARPRRREPRSVLRAGPAEFAASLPELLGFPPVESLVLLLLGGGDRPDRRLSLTLRLDLLPAEHDVEVAGQVVARVQALRPWGALVFVVSADPDDEVVLLRPEPARGATPAHRHPGPADRARPAAAAVGGTRSSTSWRRWGRRRWTPCWSATAGGGATPTWTRRPARGPGTPLDPDSSRLTGIAALTGDVVDPDRDAVVARAWPTWPASAELAQLCLRADAELDVRIARGAALGELVDEGWGSVLQAVRACVPGTRTALPDRQLAQVAVALTLVPVRDLALALAAGDDEDLTAAAEALWVELNARVPVELAAVPALLLGLAAWLRGAGVLAVAALERSLCCGPTPMAELVLQAVAANTEPAVLRAVLTNPEDL